MTGCSRCPGDSGATWCCSHSRATQGKSNLIPTLDILNDKREGGAVLEGVVSELNTLLSV